MIYRKVIKQGNSAFTITLPIGWINNNNIKGGDIVAVDVDNTSLKISTQSNSSKKQVVCNVTELSRPQIFQKVISLYLNGFDSIEINHSNSDVILDIEKEFSAMILEEHSNTFSRFVAIDNESQNLELFSKILFHLKYLGENFNKLDLKSFQIQEKLMDKLILLQIRNYNKFSNLKKKYQSILLCYIVDSIVDLLTEIKIHITSKKFSHDNSNENLKLIELYIPLYVDLIIKNDTLTLITTLREFRNSINCNSFEDGILFSLADLMYNFIGFLEK
ncbi:MAG: hypothetical protein LAT82_01990 [Nanoarchaeota archaeon]|nr:hypothetical protein [Nanoarchaeota archaeon]